MGSPVTVRKRIKVSGRVQGVWFRGSTQQRASGLGVSGWARNCADGSVEVVAAGSAGALAEFARWLAHGPPHARVDAVTSAECELVPGPGFEVR